MIKSSDDKISNESEVDEKLADLLLRKHLVKKESIQQAKNKISHGDKRQLGSILVDLKALKRSKLVMVIAEFINLPKAKVLLSKLERKRKLKNKNKISSGVKSNSSPFVMDDKKVVEDLFFTDGNVKIIGPELDVSEFEDCQMDELQVAQMATVLLADQQWEETEEYLIEATLDFPKSVILRYQLIWLYNATGYQQKAIEHSRMIEKNESLNNKVNELLGWTMLKNIKFLEAVRFYQIICKDKNSETIWFYLLALCLFKSKLFNQSTKVFKHFLTLKNTQKELVKNAQFYITQMSEQ
ncbi:MAG: hypothetical protein HRU38_00100 [Saccharospirillaceae bacterium]|nr:hypothetical protein [Pseudomonadales bacterium]NRB77063.1 hypothetical protein [Saccharospirillaceae bacterium]